MATEQAMKAISLPVAADYSAKQYYIMKLDTSGQAALAGEGSDSIGVLQDAPAAAGRAGRVAIGGICKVICGGSITKGARFSSDSNGKAVVVGSADDYALGSVLETGASGSIVSALIQPIGKS
jgi:hypothetical protein